MRAGRDANGLSITHVLAVSINCKVEIKNHPGEGWAFGKIRPVSGNPIG